MLRLFLLLPAYLLFHLSLTGQTEGPGNGITCSTQDTTENAYLTAPEAFLNGSAEIKTQFDLVFSDAVPTEAREAMQFAADIWGSYLDSEVPVRVAIDWEDRGDNRLLASAGPATLFRDFAGGIPDTWYPVALAEAIAGRDLNETGDSDINVNANSTANWYFGTDGNTPRNQIDLASVMLHELGHGLGFLASVDTINENQLSIGFGGRFIVYDLFLEAEGGVRLSDMGVFTSPSEELLMAVTNNDLNFNGIRANLENGEQEVPIFAPSVFNGGSSVSHLNESSYPSGTENALMTPFLSAGEAVHDPGPVTLGIFDDMGWPLEFILTSDRRVEREELRVYPNPASGFFTVNLPPSTSERKLTLHTADGKYVMRQTARRGQERIDFDVSKLPTGLYHLSMQQEDGATIFGSRLILR